jgi:uncharacterized protein YjcR
MRRSLRCGTKTRNGTPCQSPAVNGKKRCRMHGGAKGSGAPQGNQNALKTGFHTREAIEERRAMSRFIRDMELELREIDDLI